MSSCSANFSLDWLLVHMTGIHQVDMVVVMDVQSSTTQYVESLVVVQVLAAERLPIATTAIVVASSCDGSSSCSNSDSSIVCTGFHDKSRSCCIVSCSG